MSLRAFAIWNSKVEGHAGKMSQSRTMQSSRSGRNLRRQNLVIAGVRAALFSVSYAAFAIIASTAAQAQGATPREGQSGSQLPPIQVTAPEEKRRAGAAPARRADRAGARRRSQAARQTEPQAAPKSLASRRMRVPARPGSTPTARRVRPRPTRHCWIFRSRLLS